ncbi:maleylacetate reductase [Pseudonocardia lutea]|uniref:Maleylacetate reductase n=1 Tax=Pseudonocardia lutea TaxID=2172015 RepID=A0ABW1IF82_9PSEU
MPELDTLSGLALQQTFVHESPRIRVTFSAGALGSVRAEAKALGLARLLVVSTPEQRDLADRVAGLLNGLAAGVHPHARMHVPVPVAQAAVAEATRLGADGLVAVGGGSTIGLAKAIALESGLPIIAIPTTYAGSEMTSVWGLTEDGAKRTGRDERVRPATVVYDPELTASLPVPVAVSSGLNALAHAAEALYAPDRSPVVSLMAEEGARALISALPRLVADGSAAKARAAALYGAWLCGTCLGATTMSLHHKLCHVLGGTFDLPHAQTHAVVLPHVLAFNLPHAPAAAAALSRATGAADPAHALWEFGIRLGSPASLAALGMPATDVEIAVERAVAAPYANPVQPTAEDIRGLLRRAVDGAPPRA